MLNKLLCFMWGHEFTTFYRLKRCVIHVATYESSFMACKHCGRVKNEPRQSTNIQDIL